MSYIKNNAKLFIILLVIVLIGGGFMYYQSVLTPQLETLTIITQENETKRNELAKLERELKNLPDRKEEIIDLGYEINSLENKIPSYEVAATLAADMFEYVRAYKFSNAEVLVDSQIEQEEVKDYKTVPVNIKFESRYEDSVRFIEQLNRSNQLMTLDYYSITNELEDKEAYANQNEQILRTELVVLVHYMDKMGDKAYSNFMDYFNKNQIEDTFYNPTEEASAVKEKPETSTNEVPVQEKTTFNLHIADIFRSGDNYSFSAYAPNQEPIYVGLTSAKDTKMVLTIRENGYTCLIEDSDGNKSEKKIDTKVVNPSINITSQIQNVMEDMPQASIYIRNYTPNVININMKGTSLEHIKVYNENNKLVELGEKSGRISLIR